MLCSFMCTFLRSSRYCNCFKISCRHSVATKKSGVRGVLRFGDTASQLGQAAWQSAEPVRCFDPSKRLVLRHLTTERRQHGYCAATFTVCCKQVVNSRFDPGLGRRSGMEMTLYSIRLLSFCPLVMLGHAGPHLLHMSKTRDIT
jgi:hypothetical protein